MVYIQKNGIVVGTVTGQTLFGTFYEGPTHQGCNTGTFQITLSTDGESFQGFYTCSDNPTQQFSWNSTRVSTGAPLPKQCALLANTTTTATGAYTIANSTTINRLDFCQSSVYRASLKSNVSLPAYDTGSVYQNNLIYAGITYTENFDGSLPGSSLWYVADGGVIYHIYWAGLGQKYFNLVNDPTFHSITKYYSAGLTTDSDCRQYSYLADQPYDYYPIGEELIFYHFAYYHQYASSSHLQISCALVGFLILIALF